MTILSIDRDAALSTGLDSHSAAHHAWATILNAPIRWATARVAARRARHEFACIEPRLRLDACLEAETYASRRF